MDKFKTKFKYVPSAFESAGSFVSTYNLYPKIATDMLHQLNKQEADSGISVGVLSNAFSEKKDLIKFWEVLEPQGFLTQADSGGLQIITRGLDIDKDMRTEIYQRQAQYSHEALAFDEIPLHVFKLGVSGGINAIALFVDSAFSQNAAKTGKNIAEQILEFKKLKSKTKILFILQGKDFKSIREWAWFAFQEIKKVPDYEDYIGGLAIGNTTNTGYRSLSDFLMRFQYELEFLPQDWVKRLHVLGAGSVSKMFSFFVVPDNYFLPGTEISTDATTQTRSMIFGDFQYLSEDGLTKVPVGREYNDNTKFINEYIYKFSKPFLDEHKEEYNLLVDEYEDFREHYTRFNDNLDRKRNDFETAYDYQKRTKVGDYFWVMTMISDYLKLLASIRQTCQLFRDSEDSEDQRGIIIKELSKMLPSVIYKSVIKLIKVKSYNEYMKGSEEEIIVGHPYTKQLDGCVHDPESPIIKKGGKTLMTSMHQGVLLYRELTTSNSGSGVFNVSTTRGQFLNSLAGNRIGTIISYNDSAENVDSDW